MQANPKNMKTLSPNDFGNKFLTESCERVEIKKFISDFRVKFKEFLIKSELEMGGLKVELTTTKTFYGGVRFWLKCPICGARAAILYKHPISNEIGCRGCLNLDYRKRRYKGMIEANEG